VDLSSGFSLESPLSSRCPAPGVAEAQGDGVGESASLVAGLTDKARDTGEGSCAMALHEPFSGEVAIPWPEEADTSDFRWSDEEPPTLRYGED
jgi:hypothetical protein